MTNTKTTVAELIEKLKEFDQDARVVLLHHWGGYDDLNFSAIKQDRINTSRNFSDGGGKYCNSSFYDDDIDAMETACILNAVI